MIARFCALTIGGACAVVVDALFQILTGVPA